MPARSDTGGNDRRPSGASVAPGAPPSPRWSLPLCGIDAGDFVRNPPRRRSEWSCLSHALDNSPSATVFVSGKRRYPSSPVVMANTFIAWLCKGIYADGASTQRGHRHHQSDGQPAPNSGVSRSHQQHTSPPTAESGRTGST